jgi:hypothetical protein
MNTQLLLTVSHYSQVAEFKQGLLKTNHAPSYNFMFIFKLVIVFIKDSIYTNWLVSVIDLRREIDRVGRLYIRIWRGNHYDKNDFKI